MKLLLLVLLIGAAAASPVLPEETGGDELPPSQIQEAEEGELLNELKKVDGMDEDEAEEALEETESLFVEMKMCERQLDIKQNPGQNLPPLTEEELQNEDGHLIKTEGDEEMTIDQLKQAIDECELALGLSPTHAEHPLSEEEPIDTPIEEMESESGSSSSSASKSHKGKKSKKGKKGKKGRKGNKRSKREILDFGKQAYARWDKTVDYYPGKLQWQSQKQLEGAIADYKEKVSCIKWRKVSESACKSSKNCMYFTPEPSTNPNACAGWTYVGRQESPQSVHIMECKHDEIMIAVMIHEMGHAFGLPHTQNRDDRDMHVKIMDQNIQPDNLDQYKKVQPGKFTSYGRSYDYKSDMHYSIDTFANGNGPTMMTFDSSKQNSIGRAKKLSDGDVFLLKSAYCGSDPKITCEDWQTGITLNEGDEMDSGSGSYKYVKKCSSTGKIDYVGCKYSKNGWTSDKVPKGCAKTMVNPAHTLGIKLDCKDNNGGISVSSRSVSGGGITESLAVRYLGASTC